MCNTANEIPPNRTMYRLFLSLLGSISSSGIAVKNLIFSPKYLYLELSDPLCQVKMHLYLLYTTIGDKILIKRGTFLYDREFTPKLCHTKFIHNGIPMQTFNCKTVI